MKKLSLAYFGSPDFAADFLEKILLDKNLPVEVKLVVTQPDSPVGRKQILTPTPVKKVAEKYRVSISEKSRIKLTNIDIAIVYAFGKLIPKELLDLPRYGFWNIHPSLLPKYRGPSPIASPLINGDTTTGVTIIKMDEEVDHGPIIAQQSLTIDQDDKRPDLEKKLTDLAFKMFKDIIKKKYGQDDILSLQKTTQDHILATYTKKFEKSDGFVDFKNLKLQISNSSEDLYNLFRGLYPWPGLWTLININGQQKRLKITDLKLYNFKNFITLKLLSVQLEGKKEVDFETFNKVYKVF